MKQLVSLILLIALSIGLASAQTGSTLLWHAQVVSEGNPVAFSAYSVQASGSTMAGQADKEGRFSIKIPSDGSFSITVQSVGYKTYKQTLKASPNSASTPYLIELSTDAIGKDEIVVSAGRQSIKRADAPVLVNTVSAKMLLANQSAALADGLQFTPGARVENNCQNCGFTAVRLNGLQGPYSQILINSRPVYSALTSVYGLEQLPSSMIDRIEVVRGAGSVLYGGNAIAGTLNIITKEPLFSGWQVGTTLYNVGGRAWDQNHNGVVNHVSDDGKSAFTLYGNLRDRQAYDANDDGFTEITRLRGNTLGFQHGWQLGKGKLTTSGFLLEEFRRGGSDLDLPPHQAAIAEQLQTRAYNTNINYTLPLGSLQLQAYSSSQYTLRNSYYGGGGRIIPEGDTLTPEDRLAINAYGNTTDLVVVGGIQLGSGSTTTIDETPSKLSWVAGIEYQHNQVKDQMPGYVRYIDQQTHTLGSYGQLTYRPFNKTQVVAGLRADVIGINGTYQLGAFRPAQNRTLTALVPRLAIAQQITEQSRIRLGYAQGYRAPQAFDEDLHIESVGGSARFIRLADNLAPERSHSFTASYSLDHSTEKWDHDWLIEGFYTALPNAFVVEDAEADSAGFFTWTKRNGSGLSVSGINVEYRVQYGNAWSGTLGGTLQQSQYQQSLLLWEEDDRRVQTNSLLRNPAIYGFAMVQYRPRPGMKADLTGTYTGPMTLAKQVDANTGEVALRTTTPFLDLSLKLAQQFTLSSDVRLELFGGVQNLLNSYQRDFDRGPLRDASYVYGPMRPFTVFAGLRMGNFLGS